MGHRATNLAWLVALLVGKRVEAIGEVEQVFYVLAAALVGLT
jgi:hypothetical protein